MIRLLPPLALGLLLTGCAVAPFVTDHTAAPLGQGGKAIDFGLSPAPYFQAALGVKDDIDVGAGIELQLGYSVFGYGKWNFYSSGKRNHGFAISVLGGGGAGFSAINTQFIFAGPIGSYRQDKLEFFLHPRYNHLKYDSFSAASDKYGGFDVDGGSFDYLLVATGVQYYFKPSFAMGLTAVALPPAPGKPIYAAPGISFLFRF